MINNNFFVNNIEPKIIAFNGSYITSLYYNDRLVWLQNKEDNDYLGVKFISPNSFTIAQSSLTWDGTIEYSLDYGNTWSVWSGSTLTAQWVDNQYVICLRGTDNRYFKLGNVVSPWLSGSNIRCAGNIETLLDYKTVTRGEHPTMAEYCYSYLFRSCSGLVEAPKLNATTLVGYCYNQMFYGCPNLTTAPALPATTLARRCYNEMFYGCVGLTAAPTLPATTLETGCYDGMFQNCINLIAAPELPATTLAPSCYTNMFRNCTRLTTAPSSLPAAALTYMCYYLMFSGCASLTKAPEILATTMEYYSCNSMFEGCTNLVTPPSVLLSTTLTEECYGCMFEGCTSLTTVPRLLATTLAPSCYYRMFYGCTNLTALPAIPAQTMVEDCCKYMFNECPNITIKSTKSTACPNAYRIPTSGTGTYTDSFWNIGMFDSIDGNPEGLSDFSLNKTYYTNATIIS